MSLLDEGLSREGERLTIGGVISKVQPKVTKAGKLWALVTLEDLTGSVEMPVFPKTYEQVAPLLREDEIVFATVRVSNREGDVQLMPQSFTRYENTDSAEGPVAIQLQERVCTTDLMNRLGETLKSYPGGTPVQIHVLRGNEKKIVQVAPDFFVTPSADLYASIKVLLGTRSIL